MTPEEIKESNALIAQVVDGAWQSVTEGNWVVAIVHPKYDKKSFKIPNYHTDAAALMRVEEWLQKRGWNMSSGDMEGACARCEKGGVSVNSGRQPNLITARYDACYHTVKWIVKQCGSIQAAREWRP